MIDRELSQRKKLASWLGFNLVFVAHLEAACQALSYDCLYFRYLYGFLTVFPKARVTCGKNLRLLVQEYS
jgi:hypothetical protein